MKQKMIVLAAAIAFVPSMAMAGVPTLINEFMPNPFGADPSPQDFELIGTPGAAFSGVLVTIDMNADSSFEMEVVDNIRVSADIPEPASLGLLALGVIGMLRRRR